MSLSELHRDAIKISSHFGRIVKQVREERGWSQEVLADRANLNRSYVGEVERGSAMPSLGTVAKLAQALEISISSLLARCEQHLLLVEN
ncbi:MAG: XRE family transcriptional regulator [Moraxellaceae bacterium]|nr:MAG: XRE family transcriptional regulator [Moraxellaceae bacterium]